MCLHPLKPNRLGLMIFLCGTILAAQSATNNGKATATGTCAVSHSGNNDVITIRDCGIGKEQADKIVEMLKAILANQESDSRDAKLNELLELARKAANPYGTVVTYEPNGLRHSITQSLGQIDADHGGIDDYRAMVEKYKSGDWQGLVALAQKAMETYPGWFTPRIFLGQAQIQLCEKEEAIKSLNQFLRDTEGATAYASLRNDAQRWLSAIESDRYNQICPSQSGTSK